MQDSETDYIKAAVAGDESAFAVLVRKYQQRIAQLMWRFTHEHNLHEELTQEVFVQAYFSLSNFAFKAPFEHWLCSIATNTGYKFWKKQKRERERKINLEDFSYVADTRNNDDTGKHEISDKLFAMLQKLKPDDRMALTLMYYENLDGQEIAQQMGWNYTATRMRISRARKKLKKLIEKHAPEVAEYAY